MAKDFFDLLWQAVVLVVLFTGIDYLFHLYVPGFAVEGTYFVNKLIFGVLILFFALKFLPSHNKALWLSVITTGLLQLRYVTIYDLQFNIGVLIAHFVILYVLYYLLYQKWRFLHE